MQCVELDEEDADKMMLKRKRAKKRLMTMTSPSSASLLGFLHASKWLALGVGNMPKASLGVAVKCEKK